MLKTVLDQSLNVFRAKQFIFEYIFSRRFKKHPEKPNYQSQMKEKNFKEQAPLLHSFSHFFTFHTFSHAV